MTVRVRPGTLQRSPVDQRFTGLFLFHHLKFDTNLMLLLLQQLPLTFYFRVFWIYISEFLKIVYSPKITCSYLVFCHISFAKLHVLFQLLPIHSIQSLTIFVFPNKPTVIATAYAEVSSSAWAWESLV